MKINLCTLNVCHEWPVVVRRTFIYIHFSGPPVINFFLTNQCLIRSSSAPGYSRFIEWFPTRKLFGAATRQNYKLTNTNGEWTHTFEIGSCLVVPTAWQPDSFFFSNCKQGRSHHVSKAKPMERCVFRAFQQTFQRVRVFTCGICWSWATRLVYHTSLLGALLVQKYKSWLVVSTCGICWSWCHSSSLPRGCTRDFVDQNSMFLPKKYICM